jgi:nucleotide-binding universal stress UspA family protein
LEAEILRLGPECVAAFVAETVVGATAGVVPPAPGYFKRIREICDTHGVLLILDEVMCGMGRTGTLFACEQDGVAPDLLCLAKGLAAGYQPIGAVLASEKIFKAFQEGSGAFLHGHTYMGHPTACAAALAVQRAIQSRHLLANVRRRGEDLARELTGRLGNHAHVGDIRGRGLLLGIELVSDRASKEPFAPELKLHARIKDQAMERGLILLSRRRHRGRRQGRPRVAGAALHHRRRARERDHRHPGRRHRRRPGRSHRLTGGGGFSPIGVTLFDRFTECDVIVMASPKPALKDHVLGPTASYVVRHADCSVWVVRE